MPYCTWQDVLAVYTEAGSIVTTSALQDAILVKASGLVDNFMAPVMHTPIKTRASGGTYDPIIVESCACLAADLVLYRRARGADDISTETYPSSGRMFTGTRHLHRGMGMLDALYGVSAAIDDRITAAETSEPEVTPSLSTTNGELFARYAGGRFQNETTRSYTVTISSSGGTVAAGTLTITVVRDDGQTLCTSLAIGSGGWVSMENGLQLRFAEASSSATWTQDEYWTVQCYPPEAQNVSSPTGLSSRPLVLG